MAVYFASVVGSVSIGVYSLANEKIIIVPKMVPLKKAEKMAEWLKVNVTVVAKLFL